MKGISTVVATILMLMITIALAGTAYLYIKGTLFPDKYTCTEYKTENITFSCNILNSSYSGTCEITGNVCSKECNDRGNCRWLS